MIGIFDSGHGGLTILREVVKRMPREDFLYLGDHGHAPYGSRTATDVLKLTLASVENLFERGCTLVVLACNTASCVTLRFMQQEWLPASPWKGTHNILGIAVPTVEAATGMEWSDATTRNAKSRVGVFGTLRTMISDVYPIEIGKRQPRMKVTQQAIPELVEAIEAGQPVEVLDAIVASAVDELVSQAGGNVPEHIILGCTHYDLVRDLFHKHLPQGARIIHQPEAVADSLVKYLERHPQYRSSGGMGRVELLTTGDVAHVNASARLFWKDCPEFKTA